MLTMFESAARSKTAWPGSPWPRRDWPPPVRPRARRPRRRRAGAVRRNQVGVLPIDGKRHRAAAAGLTAPPFVQTAAGFEPLIPRRQIERDHAVGVRADAVVDRFAADPQRHAIGPAIGVDAAPVAFGQFPFQVGQLHFATGTNQSRLAPIGPIGGESVAAVADDQIQLLGPLNVNVDVDRVPRRAFRNQWTGEDRFRRLAPAAGGACLAAPASSGRLIFF